jgi:hypothetical protein
MKKLFPIVMIAAMGVLSFASCKKDYKCTCKIHESVAGFTFDTTITSDLGKQKKSDAQKSCDNASSTYNSTYGTYGTVSCSI